MTTPTQPAPVTTGSFDQVFWGSDLAQIMNLLVGGAPFANTLTRFPTTRTSVAFPTAQPDRPAWVAEMQAIPEVGLGDDALVVAVVKLASIVLLSNESVLDADVNLVAEVGGLLRDSASAELDRGCLYGQGEAQNEPDGVVAAAPTAAGADLAAALTAAVGAIGDAGGQATHICARPSVLAAARNTRDSSEALLFGLSGGLGATFGVEEVGVPQLEAEDVLVIDASRVFLVARDDFSADVSQDYAFARDAAALRIRGRFAVAAPSLDKAIRKLDIGGEG